MIKRTFTDAELILLQESLSSAMREEWRKTDALRAAKGSDDPEVKESEERRRQLGLLGAKMSYHVPADGPVPGGAPD